MLLKFPNEVVSVRGKDVLVNIEVRAHVTDASFSHAFGVEPAQEVEFTIEFYEPAMPGTFDALAQWLNDNTAKLEKACRE